ncbi:GTA-gp10 family protein [Rhodovulum visakhapatnamense]|uniref:Tail tube GTA-gp10-like protein n=1 Tax=Rhodovulum visakhapatnamense TaxID=364297 RepID=A0A4R8F2W4_9RHOB|nr:hypothetical protein [Rhodovulum visakhapatnamense]TDX19624.1 hypothetical protein EV657_1589 [Rhodovulum visakhapatnamense]
MANPMKGEVDIEACGERLRLILSFNAIAELEDEAGQTLAEVMTSLKAGSVRTMRLILWAAMRDHRPATTLRQAGAVAEELGPELGPVLGRVISTCGFLADLSDLAGEAPAPGKPEGSDMG